MSQIQRIITATFLLIALAISPAQAVDIQRIISPKGITAWLVQEDTIPLIAMRFAFDGGASQDRNGREGTANLISTLLDEGAGEMDGEAFQKRAEDLAMRYGFSAGRDTFRGDLLTLTENADEAFEMLRVALNEPRFEADSIEQMRRQIIAGIRARKNEPGTIAGNYWMTQLFPDHPYGRPVSGSEESAAAITVEDIRAYVKANFARGNLHVAVVGDIDPETLGRYLDTVFGALPEKAGQVPVQQAKLDSAPFEEGIELDIAQTVIQFGGRGLARDDEDFVPAYILNHILGGGTFSSRLYQEIREKRGLAYGVSTSLYPLDHAALFVGSVATRADRAAESLGIIKKEIARIAADGPTQEELDAAKAYLKGAYALRFDTSGKIASQLLEIQIADLGIDYIERRNGLIDAVTLSDVKRAAKRVFGEGAPFVTIVGRQADFNKSGG